jgi:hypothetical protein
MDPAHPHELILTLTSSNQCNRCRTSLGSDADTYRCDECDYDLCPSCATKFCTPLEQEEKKDIPEEKQPSLDRVDEYIDLVSAKQITLRPFTIYSLRYLFEEDCIGKMIEHIDELTAIKLEANPVEAEKSTKREIGDDDVSEDEFDEPVEKVVKKA